MFVRRQNAFRFFFFFWIFFYFFFSLKFSDFSYIRDDIFLHILQSNIFIAPVQQEEKNLHTTYHIEAVQRLTTVRSLTIHLSTLVFPCYNLNIST